MNSSKKNVPPGLFNLLKNKKKSKKFIFWILLIFIVCSGFLIGFYMQSLPTRNKTYVASTKVEPVQQKSTFQQIKEPEREQTSQIQKSESFQPPKQIESVQRKNVQTKPIPEKNKETLPESIESFKAADNLYRAYDFETRGVYQEAIAEYEEYLKITKKRDPKILNKIATLYLLTGKLPQAAYYAQEANKVAPDDQSILLNFGVINAKLEDFTRAEECFRKILSMNPENRKALYNLALLKEKKGEYEEALKLYEKLYQLGDSSVASAISRLKSLKK